MADQYEHDEGHTILMVGAIGIGPDIILGVLLFFAYREVNVSTPGEQTPLKAPLTEPKV